MKTVNVNLNILDYDTVIHIRLSFMIHLVGIWKSGGIENKEGWKSGRIKEILVFFHDV